AGTITHTETFDAKKVEERGNRTITNIISMSYKETLVLVQNRGGSRYGAAYDVQGSSRIEDQLWDKYPCGPQGGYTITTGSVADDGSTNVDIRPVYNTKDKYTIYYSPITAEATGTRISHHEDKPCSPFPKTYDKTGDANVYARTVPGQVVIETAADPAHPTDLRGTRELIVDEAHNNIAFQYGKPRVSKVQWDLHLCVK